MRKNMSSKEERYKNQRRGGRYEYKELMREGEE
jgi:hypothetical protein